MVYRVTDEQIQADQREYKKNYPPFVPFSLVVAEKTKLIEKFCSLLITQNGMDTDDYCVAEGNKVEQHLGGIQEGSRALLLGTGTGREVLVAKELGLQAVGTTLGSRNVNFGHKVLGLEELELIECANEVLPFGNDYFDVVAGFQVFEHAIAPFLFLMEVRRVMKYGAKLILEWPPAEDYHMGQNPHHQICYCPGQAKSLFEKSGFENIELFYSNNTPVPENEVWSARNHGNMLCISGIKSRHEQPFMHIYKGL